MKAKYLNITGSFNQIEQTKKIISTFNLKYTILNEQTIIQNRLFTIEIEIKGDEIEIGRLITKLQNT